MVVCRTLWLGGFCPPIPTCRRRCPIVGIDVLTGLVDYKQSGKGASTTDIQDLVYSWDDNGSLTERTDDRQSLTEEFFYDAMNRLDNSELDNVATLDMAYLKNGNIDNKDDVSATDYSYVDTVHAVTAAGSLDFDYDANGNMDDYDGSTITWTSYNKPSEINANGETSEFWYAPDRSRWKQVATYCVFRPMPATGSGACRSTIPGHAGPLFRSMPA